MTLTHFNAEGHAHMVDVADKSPTDRLAIAEACVVMAPDTLSLVLAGTATKGDVLGVARLAGIMAAKRTADLIPLCHPLPLTQASVDFIPDTALPGVRIRATVRTRGNTGVEMEALTAATVAALTIYDMLKAAEKGMRIEGVHLTLKEGGKSGRYVATGSGAAR
ncbi:cyclic pyranopterin monophosphate synthase MoaC [Phaeovulum sp. NW3]|uniref:cyclic pyranopterin monophosphate synthase MoaC n=1 Tax=Phaeovulum sp. NW3 TaxID=2934933 RepID=UPI0020200529|nr:cyclic pyranopterin monophosphate synthase MoaC [Phaeovulum sp. NW3]MCL7465171.1 cyclic pyranopterin monophosphate synthase MoaC [Phaeovulum sp. NW3]